MKSIKKRSNDFFFTYKKISYTLVRISNQWKRNRKIIQIYCNYIKLKTDFSVQVSGCGYLEYCLFQGRGKIEKKNPQYQIYIQNI